MRYVILIASIIFMLASCSSPRCTRGVCRNPADTTLPNADYYNLKGRLVMRSAEIATLKRIVLTKSRRGKFAQRFIKAGFVITVPKKEILNKMEECFKYGTDSFYEYGFAVGKKGTVSILVKGDSLEMKTGHRKNYFEDLKKLNDIPAYDIHLHPKHMTPNSDSSKYTFGNAEASYEDMLSFDVREFDSTWKYIQPNIVLGFGPDKLRENENKSKAPPIMTEYIGFYKYCNSRITCLRFDSFKNLIMQVEKKPLSHSIKN